MSLMYHVKHLSFQCPNVRGLGEPWECFWGIFLCPQTLVKSDSIIPINFRWSGAWLASSVLFPNFCHSHETIPAPVNFLMTNKLVKTSNWERIWKLNGRSFYSTGPFWQACANLPCGSAYSHNANSNKLIMQQNYYALSLIMHKPS